MKASYTKKVLALIFCAVIIATALFMVTGCDGRKEAPETTTITQTEIIPIGVGKSEFSLTVEAEGKQTKFEINTDKETVGEALIELGLIKGEDGPYGLYVKEVNGIVADYEVNNTYWAFYVDNEYALSGVDTTPIEEGKEYSFKAEKG